MVLATGRRWDAASAGDLAKAKARVANFDVVLIDELIHKQTPFLLHTLGASKGPQDQIRKSEGWPVPTLCVQEKHLSYSQGTQPGLPLKAASLLRG